jgi:hypothetical protein
MRERIDQVAVMTHAALDLFGRIVAEGAQRQRGVDSQRDQLGEMLRLRRVDDDLVEAGIGGGQPIEILVVRAPPPGRFNPWGALVAVFFSSTGILGLNFLGADSFVQNLFYGGGLMIAVSMSQLIRERKAADWEGLPTSTFFDSRDRRNEGEFRGSITFSAMPGAMHPGT